MSHHSKRELERLVARLQERHEKLVGVMQGRQSAVLPAHGNEPEWYVSSEEIRFAVDDVATALKEIRSRLGKG